MQAYWTRDDVSWYRLHLADKNYSVKAAEDPFGDVNILEIKSEWSGGKSVSQTLGPGELYDRVAQAFLAAKKGVA
jgi:hypothetical protein